MLERRDMRPGRVFLYRRTTTPRGYVVTEEIALVVLDAKREINFWTGTEYWFGDVMPGHRFEVLA